MIIDVLIKIMADFLVVPIVVLGVLALWRLPAPVRYQRIGRAFMCGLTVLFVGKIASLLYQGERPFVALGEVPKAAYLANPGFPSDHVLFVFAVTFVVWGATKDVKVSLALGIMSCLVAAGRILALVHTPVDVLGGIACALLAAVLVYGKSFFDRHLHTSQSF